MAKGVYKKTKEHMDKFLETGKATRFKKGQAPWNAEKYCFSKEELEEMYINQKLSIREISELTGISDGGIYNAMRKQGISRRRCGLPVGENHPLWKGGTSYKFLTIDGVKIKRSHYVWMMHNQFYRIPKGYVVHHIDEDTYNDEPKNLVLLPWDYHTSLHKKNLGGGE